MNSSCEELNKQIDLFHMKYTITVFTLLEYTGGYMEIKTSEQQGANTLVF